MARIPSEKVMPNKPFFEKMKKVQSDRVCVFPSSKYCFLLEPWISVSSAFFWPYPHPHEKDFQLSGTIDGGAIGSFKMTDKTKVIADDNFTRVKITTSGLSTEIFERKGKKIQALKKYTW
ncbi:MAG: hypothetical protein ABF391_00580 [Akkermansiaceae bacterium]